MSGYLLDTNVLAELLKKKPSESVLSRMAEVARSELYTSAVCCMELRFGAARRPGGDALWERIRREIEPLVSVLPLGYEEATRAGEVLADLERHGTPIGIEDVLIGSTALVHGCSIATRNIKHLERIGGLIVENWWA